MRPGRPPRYRGNIGYQSVEMRSRPRGTTIGLDNTVV
jgi:hypothetical protein